jgi:hypothetical protein
MSELRMHDFRGAGSDWNALIADLPGAHLLQTWEWAELKAAFGWQMFPVYWGSRDPMEDQRDPEAASAGCGGRNGAERPS